MGQRLSTAQWIFHFTFDLAIRFVLLNVIRGITVDTFSELRIAKILRLQDTLETCFICGINKQTFDRDRLSHGFVHHIKYEHNMWNYLFFIIYLWEQDKDDDDGLEQYVRRSIEANDIHWIPTNKAMGLISTIEKTENEMQQEFFGHLKIVENNLISKISDCQTVAMIRTTMLKNELPTQMNSEELLDEPMTWKSLSLELSGQLPGIIANASSVSEMIPRSSRLHLHQKQPKNLPQLTIQILEINGFDFPSCVYDAKISCLIRSDDGSIQSLSPQPQIVHSDHIFHSVDSMRKKSSVIHFPPNAPLQVVRYYRNTKTCNTQSVIIQILRNKPSHAPYPTGGAAGGVDSTPVTGAASHYSQIFIGYVQTSVDELLGSLGTVVEKRFEARVLDHECEGVITFIPSLSAVIANEESTSLTEE